MIALKAVSRVYDLGGATIPALRGIDLTIRRGEFLSIIGPSGSGKSTLLHVLGMLDQPSSGTYELEGNDVTGLSDRERSRIRNRHIGFVFQSFNLLPELNALENVMMPLGFAGLDRRRQRARASELLERMGLADRMFHYPNMLSGGEQQRVAIARALANDPTLILADEPTGNLPSDKGTQIFEIISGLNAAGTTVVFVTHDPRLAGWAKRLVTLQDGRIVADGPAGSRP